MDREGDRIRRTPTGLILDSGASESGDYPQQTPDGQRKGILIVNADDWGQNSEVTDRTLDCVMRGAVSSVSAMVFMKDSERAADIARERGLDAGLHVNLTVPFTGPAVSLRMIEHQQLISRFLLGHRLAQVMFHPGLVRSFEYVVATQRDEYSRLYGAEPERLDGHHHMHLCSNVVFPGLLPRGTVVRRNFSLSTGEKSLFNILYRRIVDRVVARRHSLTDFFFSLPPLNPPERIQKMFSLAKQFTVEVETHPINPDEYHFLTSGEMFRLAGDVPVASRYALEPRAD